jgi:hypothetical protein
MTHFYRGEDAAPTGYPCFYRGEDAAPTSLQAQPVPAYNQYTKINSPNQTTSTKCQYHAAASKAKWCSSVK